MEEHSLSTGNFADDEILYAWLKNPPRKPNRPLKIGDCWQSDDDRELHYIDAEGVERFLSYYPEEKGE